VNAKWLRAGCAAAAVAMLAAGCASVGNGGGNTGSAANSSTLSAMDSMSFGPPEKTTLNVGVVPAMDSAGFFVALHEGLFSKEDLTVNYTPQASSETAISLQTSGKLDISGGNYVSYIEAAMKGAPLEVISEASIMQQGSQVIFTMPNSGIKTLSELRGHMIGINAPQNIDYLLTASVLQENGIKSSNVEFPSEAIPFPQMAQKLQSGDIGAAVLPEPFASEAEQQLGAVTLADLNQGATENFAIEGYVVTKAWAQQNPNTLHRFLAALEAGQEIADTNRAAVEEAFKGLDGPTNGQVSPNIASVMALNDYPIGLDPTRLQRVSNVMFQFGLEHGRSTPFNVNSMLMPPGKFNFTPFETSESSSS
jgi:NitT/TauT family transport system substrate-binding protein